jgi:hypothetical protein
MPLANGERVGSRRVWSAVGREKRILIRAERYRQTNNTSENEQQVTEPGCVESSVVTRGTT